MKKLLSTIFFSLLLSINIISISAAAATPTKTIRTTQECSIWSKPNTSEANRVKKIPAGWDVTIIPEVVQSTKNDGKTFYKTAKGCYILCRCCDGNEISVAPATPSHKPTTGEKNAVAKAKSYLKYSAFSREGLIAQLEFEKFTNSEAQYGVDNCGADWNAQATKTAKTYLKYSSFSMLGLIDQLEFEKFTPEQAQYGVLTCGADWNEQAIKMAQSYLKYSSFSRDGLINQLVYEKFTLEQAQYAASIVY